MLDMLESVLKHLKNWFCTSVHEGEFEITNGYLELPFLKDGQYYRICGSVFNDGLYKYSEDNYGDPALENETFTGTVWALAVPKKIVELAREIEEWETKHGDAVASPYTSESFGGYSYTKATDSTTGAQATWETVFRNRLNPYRKLKETAPVKPRIDIYGKWSGTL